MDQKESSQVPFYYEFRADFVVLDSKSEVKFIKPKVERFVNEKPIVARENALMRYQNYIDVILQGIGKPYVSDRKARKDLIEYYDAIYERSIPIGESEILLNKSLSCRIGVYLTNNSPEYIDEEAFRKECEDEYAELICPERIPSLDTFESYYNLRKATRDYYKTYLIHGIEYFNGKDEIDPIIRSGNLMDEFQLYSDNALEYGNYKKKIQIWAYDTRDTDDIEILETPFDWSDYDKFHPDLEFQPLEGTEEMPPTTLQELINIGESRTMEFKPSIFYDHTKKRRGSGLPCARAISAFLNSEGGILCVGINDDKSIQGIDADFNICSPDKPEDSLKLMFDAMISNFFDPFVHNYLDTKFATLGGKRLFFVIVNPSAEPVFIKIITNGVVDRKFFIRRQASNEPLDKLEEFYDYMKSRRFS